MERNGQTLPHWWKAQKDQWIDDQLLPVAKAMYGNTHSAEAVARLRRILGKSLDVYESQFKSFALPVRQMPCLRCHETLVSCEQGDSVGGVCKECLGLCFHCGKRPWPFLKYHLDCCSINVYCSAKCKKLGQANHAKDCSFYKEMREYDDDFGHDGVTKFYGNDCSDTPIKSVELEDSRWHCNTSYDLVKHKRA